MVDEDLQGLLNYAYFFLKFRPRTVKEMRDYLQKKIVKRHWSRDAVEEAIKELKEEQLLNDKEFVRLFVEQRNSAKPKSEFVLKRELIRHGVSKDLIEEYFSDHPQNEEELAEKALMPRWHRFQNLPARERFQKAAAFLMRRGFSFAVVKKTIVELEEK